MQFDLEVMMPDPALTTWTAILAVATFAVAIVAVFEDTIRDLLGFRPELVLTLPGQQGKSADDTNRSAPPDEWHYYYHLNLTNKKKRWPATNVRVLIIRVLRQDASGNWVDIANWHGPLLLHWQLAQVHPLYETVGMDQICDLARLGKAEGFKLTPVVCVSPFHGVMKSSGDMRVLVKAVADSVESNMLSIDIHWNGEWSSNEEEMRKNLSMKESK